MKASEVLRRYQKGERNFQRVNLRGQSFKGKDLSGADFSEADIRSTNFTGAILRGANFTGAKCGLQRRWAILSTIFSWLLAIVSGFLAAFAGYFISLNFDSSSLENQISGWISLLGLVTFLIIVIHRGIGAAVVTLAVIVAGAFAGIGAFAGAFAIAFAFAGAFAGVFAGVGAIAVAGAFAGAFAGVGAIAVAVAVVGVGMYGIRVANVQKVPLRL